MAGIGTSVASLRVPGGGDAVRPCPTRWGRARFIHRPPVFGGKLTAVVVDAPAPRASSPTARGPGHARGSGPLIEQPIQPLLNLTRLNHKVCEVALCLVGQRATDRRLLDNLTRGGRRRRRWGSLGKTSGPRAPGCTLESRCSLQSAPGPGSGSTSLSPGTGSPPHWKAPGPPSRCACRVLESPRRQGERHPGPMEIRDPSLGTVSI